MRKRILYIVLFVVVLVAADRLIGWGLNRGLDEYFGLNQRSDVLFVGHSHLMLAVDKAKFEAGTHTHVSKYCREGVDVNDRYEMVRHFLSLPNSGSLKVVFYGVDQFMFNDSGLSQNSYKLFYPFMDNPGIDGYVRQSTGRYDYWLHKALCSTRYSDALINSSIRGWRHDWSNYKVGMLDTLALMRQIERGEQRHIRFEKEMVDQFESTLDLLMARGIVTVLVNTPIAKMLNEFEPDEYIRITDYFQSKAKDSELVLYWDLNQGFSDRYSLFFDPIHLNVEGQKVINEELIGRYNKTFGSDDICNHSALQ